MIVIEKIVFLRVVFDARVFFECGSLLVVEEIDAVVVFANEVDMVEVVDETDVVVAAAINMKRLFQRKDNGSLLKFLIADSYETLSFSCLLSVSKTLAFDEE